MAHPRLRLVAAAVGLHVAVLASMGCGSDPVVDEPDLVGVATVRDLKEIPDADIEAPEVSGPRSVRFAYPLSTCGEEAKLPTGVAATYTIDEVAIVVTPPPLECGGSEDPGRVVQGLEVFLAEPVDGRNITGRVASP